MPAALRPVRGERCRPAECRRIEAPASERRLDPRNTPWLGAHPAEGDARLPDGAAIHVERHRGGDHRELEGGAVAHLEVVRASGHGAGRHGDGRNDLTGFEYRLEVGRIAGQAVKLRQRHRAVSACPAHLDGCTERDQRHRKLADEYAKLPIIALTANAMAGDEERYLGLGMNDYVPKPIDPDRLTLALRRSIATDAAPIRGADLRAAPEQAPETIQEDEDLRRLLGSL